MIHIRSEDRCLLVRTIFNTIKMDRMCKTISIKTKDVVSHLNRLQYNTISPNAMMTKGIILPNHIFNFLNIHSFLA